MDKSLLHNYHTSNLVVIGADKMPIDKTPTPPIKITVTQQEYESLLTLLEQEPKENIGLKQLFDKKSPWDERNNDK